MHHKDAKFARAQWEALLYGHVSQKLRGLHGEDEDYYGCDNRIEMSQNQGRYHTR